MTLRAHPVGDSASKRKRSGPRLRRTPSVRRVGYRKSDETEGSSPLLLAKEKKAPVIKQALSKVGRGDGT